MVAGESAVFLCRAARDHGRRDVATVCQEALADDPAIAIDVTLPKRAGRGGAPLRQAVSANADAFAQTLAPVLAVMQADGDMTLCAIAADLNARGIRTRRNGCWHVSNVRNLLARLDLRNVKPVE